MIDEEDEKKVVRHLWISAPLFMVAILAPFLAYGEFLKPSGEPLEIWFQRSGSITVLFAVWMEYNLVKIGGEMNLSGIVTGQQQALRDKYDSIYRISQYGAALLAIAGTIIWGYGDLFVHV